VRPLSGSGPGAVISLQTVLGDAGVWNNFTDWVTAVVPLSRRYTRPSLGRLETAAGIFVFRGLPEAVLEAGREEDRLVSNTTYRRARPEAALLHWLYLSNSPRSEIPSIDRKHLVEILGFRHGHECACARPLTVQGNQPTASH
jgi:hypothetical protein